MDLTSQCLTLHSCLFFPPLTPRSAVFTFFSELDSGHYQYSLRQTQQLIQPQTKIKPCWLPLSLLFAPPTHTHTLAPCLSPLMLNAICFVQSNPAGSGPWLRGCQGPDKLVHPLSRGPRPRDPSRPLCQRIHQQYANNAGSDRMFVFQTWKV